MKREDSAEDVVTRLRTRLELVKALVYEQAWGDGDTLDVTTATRTLLEATVRSTLKDLHRLTRCAALSSVTVSGGQ